MVHQERVIMEDEAGACTGEANHQRDEQQGAGSTDLKRRAKRLQLVDVLR